MGTIRQNGKLSFSFFNAPRCCTLRLYGESDNLCSLFFINGTVFFQPNELGYARLSSMRVIEHQNHNLVLLQLIGKAYHVSSTVR
jgi:hypothetical protein